MSAGSQTAAFLISIFALCCCSSLLAANPVGPADAGQMPVDKETEAVIDEFINIGYQIRSNPSGQVNAKELQKKWFAQEDANKDGFLTVDENMKYSMEKMMPYMVKMATDKANAAKLNSLMRQMAAGQMALMDSDGDMKLSVAEFETAFGKMIAGFVASEKQGKGKSN